MLENDPQSSSPQRTESPTSVYLAASSVEQLRFSFDPSHRPDVRGRLEPQRSGGCGGHARSRLARATVATARAGAAERPLAEALVERAVANHLPPGKTLALKLTDNRYTIISVRRFRDGYQVRLHRMFGGCEPKIVRALARYIVHNDQRSSAILSVFIEANDHLIRPRSKEPKSVVLRTRGRVHDLGAVYERLNRRYFGGKHEARITWGVARRTARRRSIKVGSYSVEDRLIRVHPLLDQEAVPRFFLDYVVFHEMLHGKHTIRKASGRHVFHPPEFSRDERSFPDYRRARLWERANMERLLGR